MADNEFAIRASMNKEYLLPGFEMKNLVAMVEVRARAGTRIKELPKNICFVIDRSSSMDGTKMMLAKAAIKETIKSLAPADTVSVVAFSDDVGVVLEASPVKDRELLAEKIEKIALGTATDLYSGITAGLEQLKKSAGKGRLNKMYLLTDGDANVGKTMPEDFRKVALLLKENRISVDTFGIGADYNEDVLNAISNNSMGEWVHVSEIPDLNKKVMDHVTKLKTVICSSPVLKITPSNATAVYDIKRLLPSVREVTNVERSGEAVRFPIGDIDAVEPQAFYMRVDTKAMGEAGRHPVMKIEIEGRPAEAITLNAIWTEDVEKLRLENTEIRAWDTLNKTIIKGLKDPNDGTVLKDLSSLKTEVKTGPVATVIKEAETMIRSGELEGDAKKLKYEVSTVTSTSLKPKESGSP